MIIDARTSPEITQKQIQNARDAIHTRAQNRFSRVTNQSTNHPNRPLTYTQTYTHDSSNHMYKLATAVISLLINSCVVAIF